jgi:hypothetical protein
LERLPSLKVENAGHFFGGKDSVEIGVDAFSAKVLCDVHNNGLSPLDDAAGLAFSTTEALTADLLSLAQAGAVAKNSFYLCSGLDLERWLIKVFCALVAAGKIKGQNDKPVPSSMVSTDLVRTLLGQASLVPPTGLYVEAYPGQQLSNGIRFSTIKLPSKPDEVGGLIFHLGMLAFVLVTHPGYGKLFSDDRWRYRPSHIWKLRQMGSSIDYLLTY